MLCEPDFQMLLLFKTDLNLSCLLDCFKDQALKRKEFNLNDASII